MGEDFEQLSRRVSQLRGPHDRRPLEVSDLDPDPFEQFAGWLEEALAAHPDWPNAMTLATADARGRPSARMVLLKGIDESGFVFYTNKDSRKGRELDENPHAALLFYWPALEQQVRVSGAVTLVPEAEADGYFATRPFDSKLGAWASRQSEPLESRAALEAEVERYRERFGDDVPRPPHWGGYRLIPTEFEFWRSQPDRLHDRFLYRRGPQGTWTITRLHP